MNHYPLKEKYRKPIAMKIMIHFFNLLIRNPTNRPTNTPSNGLNARFPYKIKKKASAEYPKFEKVGLTKIIRKFNVGKNNCSQKSLIRLLKMQTISTKKGAIPKYNPPKKPIIPPLFMVDNPFQRVLSVMRSYFLDLSFPVRIPIMTPTTPYIIGKINHPKKNTPKKHSSEFPKKEQNGDTPKNQDIEFPISPKNSIKYTMSPKMQPKISPFCQNFNLFHNVFAMEKYRVGDL